MFRKTLCLVLPVLCSVTSFIVPQTQPTVQEMYAAGNRALLDEDYYEAIDQFRTVIQTAPHYIEPLLGLAESYFALEEFDEALQWIHQAKKYDKNNSNILVFEARILSALGRFEEARQLFNTVLTQEPHNIEARFGLGELNIIQGRVGLASTNYNQALRFAPHNKRALLSLALVYDSEGKEQQAEALIREALRLFSHDPQVHFFAAKHYLYHDEYERAELQAKTALSLKEDYIAARLLLSRVYIRQQSYEQVIPLLRSLLAKQQNNNLLWYMLGLAHSKLGQYQESVNSFSRAFRMRSDDEISRIALEHILIREYDIDDPLRAQFSEHHIKEGSIFEERNFFQRALEEYRRGLKLYPFSKGGRLRYAQILYKLGQPARYVSQLRVLIDDIGYTTPDILDEYEIHDSLLLDSVANRWNVRQFPPTLKDSEQNNRTEENYLSPNRFLYKCMLFYTPGENNTDHFACEQFLIPYFRDMLLHNEQISIVAQPMSSESFSFAYEKAREANAHYFLIISLHETQRAITVRCAVYSAKTGDHIQTYTAYKTGNDKVKEAFGKIEEQFLEALPLRGSIIDRRFDSGLVNLGSYDGVQPENTFLIIKNGAVGQHSDRFQIEYDTADVLGEITITATDELVAEGLITTNLFFDMINPGDEIIPEKQVDEESSQPVAVEPEADSFRFTDLFNLELYRDLITIR